MGMDGVKRVLNEREMFVEQQGRMIVYDRGEWRTVVNVWPLKDVPTHLVWSVNQIRWGEGEGLHFIEVALVKQSLLSCLDTEMIPILVSTA